ncbi:MAG TPA: hypothetical protein VGO07_01870 [Candidatus Saccharimonadales bacterium]|jgi:hypothetical protein|nr:hypothetical protein [Candidatus Saccharimonadales bacterium]
MRKLGVACKDYRSLRDGRVLAGHLRIASDTEREAGYYFTEPVIIPDGIHLPTDTELRGFAAEPDDPDALRLFGQSQEVAALSKTIVRAHREHMRSAREGTGREAITKRLDLELPRGIMSQCVVIRAKPNTLSTSVASNMDFRKPGMHPDMWPEPTWGAGLCLNGSRYIVVGDVGVEDIPKELRWLGAGVSKVPRRDAFRKVVEDSLISCADGTVPPERLRECLFLRVDAGEMYSGVPIAEQLHDGSSLGQAASRLALITTRVSLPIDLYSPAF